MKIVSVDKVSHGSVDEAAAYWVMRLDAPSCRPTDRAAFEKWRTAHTSHARAYARARQALAIVDQHLGSIEMTDLGEQVFEETGRSRRPLFRSAGTGFAVACTLILGVFWTLQDVIQSDVDQQLRIAESTFETAVGERSTVTLPDESVVLLNTDTLVEVRFTQTSDVRRLVLLRGQAHFDVVKDPRPFEVFAGGRHIVALGTAFDIRIDEELGVLVTLIEGRVFVDGEVQGVAADFTSPAPVSTRSSMKATRRTILKAGEQLIARPDEPQKVIMADIERVVGWREGRLVFRDDPLRDAVKEINRYSIQKLFIDDDDRLDAIQIGGVFKTGNTESFVAAVEALHPVEARRVALNRIALVWVDKTSDRKEPVKPQD